MGAEMSFDRILEAMGDRYRRQLLLALIEHNPQDADDPTPTLNERRGEFEDDGQTTKAVMHHAHLPKLEEFGYIHWDRDAGKISKGPAWDEIAPFIRLLDDHSDELPVGWV